MHLLFITPYIPSEISGHAGAQLICRNITSLAKIHKITLATFINNDEEAMVKLLEDSGIEVNSILYPRNQKSLIGKILSIINNIVPILTYIKGGEPFFWAKYKKLSMTNLIKNLVNENEFDLVQIEYNVMHHYASHVKNIPKVIVFHDISTKVHERGMMHSKISFEKRNYQIAKQIEPKITEKFNGVITLTNEDKRYLKQLGCETRISVIPPQIKIPSLFDIQKVPHSMCFIGSFNRKPNIQAVEILLEQIYPIIFKKLEKFSINIAGIGLPQKIIKKISLMENVSYLGFINNINSFLAKQSLMVAPIKIGAGLKMKIPHALACGTPVITTSVGAEGIPIGTDAGLWITDSIQDMVKIICYVLPQTELLAEKGKFGREKVENHFSEDRVVGKILSLYSKIINK